MLKEFELTGLETIFTTMDGEREKRVKVRCSKKDPTWMLTCSSVDGYDSNLSLYDIAQLISEILAKDEINAIYFSCYDKSFIFSEKMSIEEVLVKIAKEI